MKKVAVCKSGLTVSHLAWSALAYITVNSVKNVAVCKSGLTDSHLAAWSVPAFVI